jgi:hypothetical protein
VRGRVERVRGVGSRRVVRAQPRVYDGARFGARLEISRVRTLLRSVRALSASSVVLLVFGNIRLRHFPVTADTKDDDRRWIDDLDNARDFDVDGLRRRFFRASVRAQCQAMFRGCGEALYGIDTCGDASATVDLEPAQPRCKKHAGQVIQIEILTRRTGKCESDVLGRRHRPRENEKLTTGTGHKFEEAPLCTTTA